MKYEYGITEEEYKILLKRQKGKCAICRRLQRVKRWRLAIDHNHRTGKYRGLLCNTCNTAIAFFNEDIIILQRAIEYLKEHSRRLQQKSAAPPQQVSLDAASSTGQILSQRKD